MLAQRSEWGFTPRKRQQFAKANCTKMPESTRALARIFGLILSAQIAYGLEVVEFRIYQGDLLESVRYLVSEKYDGVRGVWDSKELKTKRGNPINAPRCFIEQLPPFALDGELWLGYGRFEEMASLVKRQDSTCEQWRDVVYLVFDSPSCGLKDAQHTQCTLSERLEAVRAFLSAHHSPNVRLIAQHILEPQNPHATDRQLHAMLETITQSSGEGLIIRPDERGYRPGRAKNAFKLKPHTDSECQIIGYTQGNGRAVGKVGALICEQVLQSNGDNPLPPHWQGKRITFKIGSGLSDALRANPPRVGTTITYQYNGFSKNGIPKHTRFVRISNP